MVMLGVCTALAFILFTLRSSSTAYYRGRSADAWLGDMGKTNQAAVLMAFKVMGTNALPALVRALEAKDKSGPMARFYGREYQKLPHFIRWRLAEPISAEQSQNAAELLFLKSGNARMVLPDLLRIMEHGDEHPASFAGGMAAALVNPNDTNAIPILERCLTNTNYVVRRSAAVGLGRIGSGAETAVPTLTNALQDPMVDVRICAAYALWKVDGETNMATSVLKKAMENASRGGSATQRWSAIVLSEVNPGELSALPVLLGYFDDRDYSLAREAVSAVGRYGPAATSAVPALTYKIDTGDRDMRERALESLKRIDPAEAAKYEGK